MMPLCSVSVSVTLRPFRAPCWVTPMCRLGSKLGRDIMEGNTIDIGTGEWAGVLSGVGFLGGEAGGIGPAAFQQQAQQHYIHSAAFQQHSRSDQQLHTRQQLQSRACQSAPLP